ncbi:MAG: PleD family two-component system response regulator [Bacteriovoracaceae bacterium]
MQEQMNVHNPTGRNDDEYMDMLVSSRRRKKVMVVDDDLDHRLIVAEMLVNAGYTVMTAKDGEVALNTLIHNADKPDLIILDLMMPEKDGLAFRKDQKNVESIAHIPVVFLSGQGLVEGETCLMKPVDERVVLKTVEEAMAK